MQNTIKQHIETGVFDISILCVEDDDGLRLTLKKFLQKKVKQLYMAKNGKEGLDLYLKHKPNMVISDIRMPVMDGLEMIKKFGEINNSKIYVTSAYSEKQNLLEAIDVGIDGFFVKPINFEKLERAINKISDEKNLRKQLKKKEEEVKKTEKYFQELFENSNVGIYKTLAEGKILSANLALCKMLGYSSFEELSKSIEAKDVYQDKATRAKYITILNKKGYINAAENKWLTKDNRLIYVRETTKKLIDKDGNTVFVGTVENITSQKKAEFKLLQIAIELRNLLDNANVPIIGIDKKGKINEWNVSADDLLQFTKTEIMGKDFVEEFIYKNDRKKMNNVISDTLDGLEVTNYKCTLKTRQNKYLRMLLSTTLRHDYFGNVRGVMVIAQDITELEEYKTILEKKVEDRTYELKRALEKEKELSELKSRFVAMTSHEFRTPLSVINFAAGYLKKYDGKLNQKQRKQKLLKIEHQVEHMTYLLENILHLGKIDSKKTTVKQQKLNFSDFIRPIIDEVYYFSNNSHSISVKFKSPACSIYIDPFRGKNIFVNLLSNAVKFSPRSKQVQLTCDCSNTETIVEIIDFGIGIKQNEQKLIFDDFFRGGNVETIQGTGLGLSIAKRNIELHNGEILMETVIGRGTKFTVKLPLS